MAESPPQVRCWKRWSEASCARRSSARSRQKPLGVKNSDVSSRLTSCAAAATPRKPTSSQLPPLSPPAPSPMRCASSLCEGIRPIRNSLSPAEARRIRRCSPCSPTNSRLWEFRCGSPMNSDCPRPPKRPQPSRSWRTKPGISGPRTFRLPPERGAQRSWGRFHMRDGRRSSRIAIARALVQVGLIALLSFFLLSCSSKPDASTVVMIIESSPTNLDPRVGIDAQSERIDELIFDALLTRDEHLNVQPGLAESWNIPDPLTYVFHLHSGVKFHDGRPLTARDVKWTFDSL